MSERRLPIVDDEAAFARFIKTVAEEMGFEVRLAISASQFRETYAAFDPELIFLDIVMPEADGIELLRWLADRSCQAQVVFMTGGNPEYAIAAQKLAEAKGLNAIHSLTKPIPVADLRQVLGAI